MGKFLETWEKDWFSFWKVADKLAKVGSVFGKLLTNSEKHVGSGVRNFLGPASYDPLDLALSSPSWLHVFPPGLPVPSNRPKLDGWRLPISPCLGLPVPSKGPKVGWLEIAT